MILAFCWLSNFLVNQEDQNRQFILYQDLRLANWHLKQRKPPMTES